MRHVPALSYPRGRGVGQSRGEHILADRVLRARIEFPDFSSRRRLKRPLDSAISLESAFPWKALRKWITRSETLIKATARTTKTNSTGIAGRIEARIAAGIESKRKATKSKAAPRVEAQARQWTQLPFGYNKMKSHIQFITTPTSDTPGTALLLHFDDRRYIVGNVHEGLQRAGLQVGAKFFKAKELFLTGRTEWQTNGGLLGMILTLADSANSSAAARSEMLKLKAERLKQREEEDFQRRKPSKKASSDSLRKNKVQSVEEDPTVTIHGGPNLTHVLATARSFVFRKGTPIKVIEHHEDDRSGANETDWEPTWADNRIQVWAIAITPSSGDDSSPSPRPISPRKRSLGEFMEGKRPTPAEALNEWSIKPSIPHDQAEQDQKVRGFVVSEMFGSKWRYDNLVETSLHQVKMPAALFVRDPHTHKIEKYTGPIPDGTRPIPNIKVLVRQPWPGALIDHLPPTTHSATAMSYIIRNHKQRGKFKPAAAKALNIPRGPLWAALAAGEDVQLEDGKTITPDMVLEPGKEGAGFAIVELPSRDYVKDLVERAEWKAEKPMTGLEAIVWLLGAGVARDETLIAFMKEHSALKHVVSSPDQCPDYLSMTSAASAAIRHHQIDPARYPIPVHNNSSSAGLGPEALPGFPDQASISWLPAKRGLKIQLEPTFAVEEKEIVPYLNTALVVQETPQEVIKLGQAAQNECNKAIAQNISANYDLPGQDAEIICLGTGSASPSQHRNVSATLLRVPGSGSYLLDCGENTLGQLKRIYSELELSEVLQDLKMIWISHLHADHHLGTASVIKAWYEEVHGRDPTKRPRPTLTEQLLSPGKFLEEGKRLFVVGHRNMLRWLEEYSSVEDFGYNQLIPLEPFPAARSSPDLGRLEWNGMQVGFDTAKDSWVKSAIRKATGLSNLVTASVNHCYGALAVSLTFPTGFKFSYSGDCRPSKDFALIGKGTTVLLHEATFDDELKGDALAKKHSTTSEAIGVGAAMGARRVILTHFSQRYQKIPSINSMNSLNVQLEDADHSEETADAPVDESIVPVIKTKGSINSVVEGEDEIALIAEAKTSSRDHHFSVQRSPAPTSGAFSSLNSFSTLIQPPPKPNLFDIKVGVAFDYMRVKVGNIIHLEKFNPAMRELYKEAEEDERAKKEKAAARSDNGVEDQPAKLIDGERGTRHTEEKAEKARNGQAKTAKRKAGTTEKWEREKGGKTENAIASNEDPQKEIKIRESLSFDPSILIEKIQSRDQSPNDGNERSKGVKRISLTGPDEAIPSSPVESEHDISSASGEDTPDKPRIRRSPSDIRSRAARRERRAAARLQEEGEGSVWVGRSIYANTDAAAPAPEAVGEGEGKGKGERAVQ